MSTRPVLVLHGWGGNKPTHWQEHLAASLEEAGARVVYPRMPHPEAPDRTAWLAEASRTFEALRDVTDTLTVVAHSLGAITYLHIAAAADRKLADRVLLVAPPYVVPGIPPWSAPETVDAFFPPPLDAAAVARAARETHLVGGDDDDYATWEQMETYARRLGIGATCLKGAGHISPYWGYGDWPWVAAYCLGDADLPPQPRPAEG